MSNKFNPKVSIIIPVYNGANFLEEAIQSAIEQTYKNLEILVVNDGSNDQGETERIAMKYIDKIKYYYKENGGVATALNLALEKMTGEYFSWLSHDDLYYKDKIEKQINFIEANNLENEKVFLFGDYSIIDEKGNLIAECKKNHKEIEEKEEYSLLRGHVNGITVLIPKKAFEECGKFDESLKCTQDYDLWQKMMKEYKFIHQPEILSKTRVHGKQDTVTSPKVVLEGNKLWINLIEHVTDERKIELEGNIIKYYQELSDFLESTPYLEAKNHCDRQIEKGRKQLKEVIDKIKVSIIIPFYNRAEITMKAIESALKQTHKNIEIILVNDGSNSNVKNLEEKIKNIEKIKYIKLEENHGTGYSRNIGIKNAIGEYIAFLDSDDLFVEAKIEKQLEQMYLNNAIFSHTSYLRKNRNNGDEEIIHTGCNAGKLFPNVIGSCAIATPTVMIKRQYLIDNELFYINDLSLGEDICFYIRVLENITAIGIDEPLSIVNVDTTSAAYNYEKQLKGLKNIMNFALGSEKTNIYNLELYRLFKEFIRVYNVQNGIEEIEVQYIRENKNLCEQLKNQREECEMKQQTILILNNQIMKINQSRSMRITVPLRKIAAFARKILRKIKSRVR